MDLDALDAIFCRPRSALGGPEPVRSTAVSSGGAPELLAGTYDASGADGSSEVRSERSRVGEDIAGFPLAEAEPAHLRPIPDAPSWDDEREKLHGFTRGELLAFANPVERPPLEADEEVLEAFAIALRLAEIRASGERPSHYTRLAYCIFCGPVWLFPGEAKQVLGCPWCENTANGGMVPRPPVSCADCCHWRANVVNPSGALGCCLVEAPASKRPGSLWPRGEIYCGVWRPTTEGELR